MKILLAALFLISLKSYSLQVEYFPSITSDGTYQNTTKITCDDSESKFCLYMCGYEKECFREEMTCTSCAGRQDMLLRILFTQSNTNFTRSNQKWKPSELAAYLFDNYYVLLSYRSILNFHKAWGAKEILEAFRTFCPLPTHDPLLIVSLNNRNQPQHFIGVICRDENNQSYVEAVRSTLDLNYELEQLTQ